MSRRSRLCFTLICVLLPAGTFAEGVSVTLENDDEFSVGNADEAEVFQVDGGGTRMKGSGHVETLPPGFGGAAEDDEVGLAISTGTSGGVRTYPLVIHFANTGFATWFNVAGGYLTPNFIRVDGRVRGTYDPATRKLTVLESGAIEDPDGPGNIASMGQFGADVENVLVLRAARHPAPVNGRPEAKLILGMDREHDWVWKVEDDGRQCWGSPEEKGLSSWDLCLERVDDAGFEYPRFTLDHDGSDIEVNIKAPLVQGTGSAQHGPLIWGDGSDDFDTGDEACQAQNLSCETSFTTAGLAQPCSFDHGVPGSYFFAFCK